MQEVDNVHIKGLTLLMFHYDESTAFVTPSMCASEIEVYLPPISPALWLCIHSL